MVVIFFVTIINSYAQNKMRIAVLDITASKNYSSYAQVVRSKIEYLLFQSKKFKMLERNIIQRAIKNQNFSKINYKNTKSAIKLGEILSAEYIVIGSVDVANGYFVNLRIVDVRSGEICFSNSQKFEKKEEIISATNWLASILEDAILKIKDNDLQHQKKKSGNNYKFHFAFIGSYATPRNSFKNIVKNGYGAEVCLGIKNLFLNNLILGFDFGYYDFEGKDNTEYAKIMPIMFHLEYQFDIYNGFYLSPLFSYGTARNSLVTDDYNETMYELIYRFGFHTGYQISSYSNIFAGAYYSSINEKSGDVVFINYNFGIAGQF